MKNSTKGEEEVKQPKNLDEIYKSIKSYGYYQLFFLATIQYGSIVNAGQMAAGFFSLGGLIPTYICQDEGFEFELSPKEIRENSDNACTMIRNCTNLTTRNYWYSMYEEFEWVCESDMLRSTVASLMPFVSFISYSVSGHVIDYFGRKWIMVFGFMIELLCDFGKAFTPNFPVYIVLNVIGSLAGTVTVGASFSLTVESVHSKYRLIQSFGYQWSLGFMLAGLSCYLTGSWRRHLLLMNFLSIPVLLMMLKLEESPRFLLQKQKYKEAAAAINRIARFNGRKDIQYTEEDLKEIQLAVPSKKSSSDKKYTFIHLFSNWKLTSYAVSQIVTGFTMNVVNGVMFFNIQDLAGNPFLNISLMGALRLWTPFAGVALENGSKNFGRKTLFIVSQGIVALCFMTMFIIDLADLSDSLRIIGTGSALIGYALETGLVWIAYKLYTTELFPTVIRTIALNTFSSTSLFGSMLSPQLVYIKKFWHPAPFSGAAISSGISVLLAALLLPETKFMALPDTIDEATKRGELPVDDENSDRVEIRPLHEEDVEQKEGLLNVE